MSRSCDLCIKIAQQSERSSFADREWHNAKEIPSEELFEKFKELLPIIGKNIEIKFDEDVEPDYFTSCSLCHDGTEAFESYAFLKCMENVLFGKTYCTEKGKPKTKIRYTVGNFVLLNEYGKFRDNYSA